MNTVHAIDSCPVFRIQGAAYENVATEQRNFDGLLAIAPAVRFADGRKKGLHTLLLQTMLGHPLMSCPCMQRIPAQFFTGSQGRCEGRNVVTWCDATHSFALWVPLHGSA